MLLKIKIMSLTILMLMLLSGCATSIVRLYPGKEKQMRDDFIGIYPATIFDGILAGTPFSPLFVDFKGTDASEAKAMCFFVGPVFLVCGLIDMPFSIISDTLMIPYDLCNRNSQIDKTTDVSKPATPNDG